MDIRTLHYFVELTKDLHFTNTANRLFISQQTLSNYINRLENELDILLFERKPALRLTTEGKVFLEYSLNSLNRYKELIDKLTDNSRNQFGDIRIGASPLRINTILPDIISKFSEYYPNVLVHNVDSYSEFLEEMILKDELDMAIVLSRDFNYAFESTPILKDQIFLCMNKDLIKDLDDEKKEFVVKKKITIEDLKNLSSLSFVMLNNRLGDRIKILFESLNFNVKVYATCSSIQTSTLIGLKGNAAFFSTKTALVNYQELIEDDTYIFPVFDKGTPLSQELSLITLRNKYRSQYEQLFEKLIHDELSYLETMEL